MMRLTIAVYAIALPLSVACRKVPAPPSTPPQSLAMGAAKSRMTFFVTSVAPAKGSGDAAAADAHCQALAMKEGAGDHTWRAYVDPRARDRIGKGPWYDAEAELVAANLNQLLDNGMHIPPDKSLNERGDPTTATGGRFYCFAID